MVLDEIDLSQDEDVAAAEAHLRVLEGMVERAKERLASIKERKALEKLIAEPL